MTLAARTSVVLATARAPSRPAGVLNVRAIVCRMLSGKALVAGVAALVLLAGVGGYGGYRVWRHLAATAPRPAPSAAVVVQAPPTPEPTATATATPAPTPLPASVLVKVPYTSQFPTMVFGGKYEEYCEAAALLM